LEYILNMYNSDEYKHLFEEKDLMLTLEDI